MIALIPEGTFNAASASALRDAIVELSGRLATVDFSHVRAFEVAALAAFVGWLAQSGLRVKAIGLPGHELRVLRYLGFGLERWSVDAGNVAIEREVA